MTSDEEMNEAAGEEGGCHENASRSRRDARRIRIPMKRSNNGRGLKTVACQTYIRLLDPLSANILRENGNFNVMRHIGIFLNDIFK
jgi:hypothetical protein